MFNKKLKDKVERLELKVKELIEKHNKFLVANGELFDLLAEKLGCKIEMEDSIKTVGDGFISEEKKIIVIRVVLKPLTISNSKK